MNKPVNLVCPVCKNDKLKIKRLVGNEFFLICGTCFTASSESFKITSRTKTTKDIKNFVSD